MIPESSNKLYIDFEFALPNELDFIEGLMNQQLMPEREDWVSINKQLSKVCGNIFSYLLGIGAEIKECSVDNNGNYMGIINIPIFDFIKLLNNLRAVIYTNENLDLTYGKIVCIDYPDEIFKDLLYTAEGSTDISYQDLQTDIMKFFGVLTFYISGDKNIIDIISKVDKNRVEISY